MSGSVLAKYTAAVMAIACRKCGAEPLKRCRPANGSAMGLRPIPPHAVRVRDATYQIGCYLCQMGDPHEVHRTPEEFWSGENGHSDLTVV